jgi:hypothetical protein
MARALTFDWSHRRFPAALRRVAGGMELQVTLVAARGAAPALEVTARGRTVAECDRRLRAGLAGRGRLAVVDRAYARASRTNAWVRVRRSTIDGTGVVAQRPLGAGLWLEDVTRPLVRYARVPRRGDPAYGHAVQAARGWWLLLDHSAFYYLNHSCASNTRLVLRGARADVETTKAIRRGEELTLDYATVAFRDDPYGFPCRCGAARCRGYVRGRRRA